MQSDYTYNPDGSRTLKTSTDGYGDFMKYAEEQMQWAREDREARLNAEKAARAAAKQNEGLPRAHSVSVAPQKSDFQRQMEQIALQQAQTALTKSQPSRTFAPADMAPIRYTGGPGIIPGATMDVMNMTYEQRQKFLPKESDKMLGPDQGAFLKSQSDIAKSQANLEAAKADLFKKAMAGDPAAIARLQEMQ